MSIRLYLRRLRAVALVAGLLSCAAPTEPQPFLHATFSLSALDGKPLPLPDGGFLLVGDFLAFSEARRPRGELRSVLEATIIHQRPDGSRETIVGLQSYERRGDTVVTSFYCRFSDICVLVYAPELGVFRNDSLVFHQAGLSQPSRVYLKLR